MPKKLREHFIPVITELQKTNQKEFWIEKVIKKISDKLYVKWKVYNRSFNSWIVKKDLIK